MPIVTEFKNGLFYLLSLFLIGTAQAEIGKGIVQDPVTREYTEGVVKDWQEGIVRNPDTGDYVITYKNDAGSFSEIIYEPSTKIEPSLKSKFKHKKESHLISYSYKLKNSSHSKQPIDDMGTIVSSIYPLGIHSPPAPEGWEGASVPDSAISATRLGWRYRHIEKRGGLAPGKSLSGFFVESYDLPGVAVMEISGASLPTAWLGLPDISTEIGQQIEQLSSDDFVARPAAAPKIPVPDPFDAAAVLVSLQKHVKDDLVDMELIDPVFAAQLDRLFATAIAAVNQGNLVAARHDIKELKRLLHKEHKGPDKEDNDKDKKAEKDDDDEAHHKGKTGLITKLAAKVLDFDLKYIEKRLKHE